MENQDKSIPSFRKSPSLFAVYHQHFATDRYVTGSTIVSASSKEEAMDKLNMYLDTKPNGAYTAEKCLSIKDIYELNVLD